MNVLWTKTLESCTVCAGLVFLLHQIWTLHPTSKENQNFVALTVFDTVLSLLLAWRFNLKTSNIYRTEDQGLWCCFLVPVLIKITQPGLWELIHCLVPVTLTVYLGQTEHSPGMLVASVAMVGYGVTQAVLLLQEFNELMLVLFMVYGVLLWYIPRWFPKSFTFGEVTMVTQILTYFSYTTLSNIYLKAVFVGVILSVLFISLSSKFTYPVGGVIATILAVGLCFCLPIALYMLGWSNIYRVLLDLFWSQTSILLLAWWVVCTLFSILLVMKYGSQPSEPHNNDPDKSTGSLYDQVSTLSMDDNNDRQKAIRTPNLGAQSGCEMHKKTINRNNIDKEIWQAGDLNDMSLKISKGNQMEIKGQGCDNASAQRRVPLFVRKYFHLAMLCVFVPGLLYQPDLLYLASAGAAAVLINIEAVRVSGMPPFTATLNQYLTVFLDQQDQGHLILTPVYLLVGCCLPLWLVNRQPGTRSPLCLYAGLISVGVGDSAASVIGRKYGNHKWPGSPKSVEGTVAAMISQIVVVLFLGQCGVPDYVPSVVVMVTMCLSACMEAFSTQIDNLVVPVFTFILLAVI